MNSLILEIHTNHVSSLIIHLLYLLSFQQSSCCNNFLWLHLGSLGRKGASAEAEGWENAGTQDGCGLLSDDNAAKEYISGADVCVW